MQEARLGRLSQRDVISFSIVARAGAHATVAGTSSLRDGDTNDTAMFALIGAGPGNEKIWLVEPVGSLSKKASGGNKNRHPHNYGAQTL